MSKLETKETKKKVGGNTKTPTLKGKKQANQLRYWFFTFNNYIETDITVLCDFFNKSKFSYIFQEEIGENKTIHLQGCIDCKQSMRWTEFNLSKNIHWESVKSIEDSKKYCSKACTRNGKIFFSIDWEPEEELMLINDLDPWQLDVQKIALDWKPMFSNRIVNWIWENDGNVGKSVFSKMLSETSNTVVIQGGSYRDLISLIGMRNRIPKCVIFDIPREDENNLEFKAVECLATGSITNTKYECFTKNFNPPIIMVFSNFAPGDKLTKLSRDRWRIYKIINKHLYPQDVPSYK